jgi:hypothetical protein
MEPTMAEDAPCVESGAGMGPQRVLPRPSPVLGAFVAHNDPLDQLREPLLTKKTPSGGGTQMGLF